MDYGCILLSHATTKPFMDPRTGAEYDRMVPTLPNASRIICNRMCDIIAYSTSEFDENGNVQMKLKLRGTPRYDAGCRFKHIVDEIPFTYQSLVDAIGDAIDKQEQETNNPSLFTDNGHSEHVGTLIEYDFDMLMTDFNNHVNRLMTKDVSNQPKIMEIVERHLGLGNKVADMNRNQAEILSCIVDELETL
jgi:hypothetical protein